MRATVPTFVRTSPPPTSLPRYRELTRDCLAGVPEFGVVLIERGSEVGGGDVRTNVGTVARIVASQVLPDGRAYLMTVGTRRIRVTEWLEDAPYPRATVPTFVRTSPPPTSLPRSMSTTPNSGTPARQSRVSSR